MSSHCVVLQHFLFTSFFALLTVSVASEKTPITYNDHVKPIFRQHCLKCHGDDKQKAGINLQIYANVLKGGSAGEVVIAGRSSQSLLFQVITNPDDNARMPPYQPPLPDEQIAMIQRWIDTGLRESMSSKSMVKTRDLTFQPTPAGIKRDGFSPMPQNLRQVKVPQVKRPLPVLAMDASPWAPLLAVSAQEHVRLIHTKTEKEVGRLAFPEGIPYVIRFSRDGVLLMVAGGRPGESGKVVLFDIQTGQRLTEIGDEIDAVIAADLSPDQRLVALGGSGRVVKVYLTTEGTLCYRIERHTDWITAVSFSPDGSKLVTADRAGGIHLWDANSGKILLSFLEHKEAVRALDWRIDSKVLASMGEDGRLIWWDVTDGFPATSKTNAHPPKRPTGVYGRIPNGVLAGRFDQKGNLVTTGRDQVVRLWAPNGNQKKSFTLESGIPISSSIANEGKTVISGDSAGLVRFWRSE